MKWVTVFQSFSAAEAHVVRSRLEAAKIPAHIAHELSSFSMEGYSMAAGGILVQVPSDLVEHARTLIEFSQNTTE